jgi:hypothetical protein
MTMERLQTRRTTRPLWAYTPLMLVAACATEVGQDGSMPLPAVAEQALINGVEEKNEYDVKVSTDLHNGNAGLCTGTLLTNSVVLTAQHCIEDDCQDESCGLNPGTGIRSPVADMSVTQYTDAATTTKQAVALEAEPGLDVALVHLDQPFEVAGSTLGFSTQLYGGDPDDLVGNQMRCKGYGASVCSGSSIVKLRHADMPMDATAFDPADAPPIDELFVTVPNAEGQSIAGGDSGGSCQLNDPGSDYSMLPLVDQPILGVNSMCNVNVFSGCPTACGHVKADAFRIWAQERVSSASSDQGDDYADPYLTISTWGFWGPSWTWQPEEIRGPDGVSGLVGGVQNVTAVFNAGVHVDVHGSGDEAAGVIARYRNPANFTGAFFHDSANLVIIFDVRDGVPIILASGPAEIEWDGGHRISLLVNDTYAVAALDGQQVLAAPLGDASFFMSGKAGLFQGSSTGMYFDNFEINHIDVGS